MNTSFIDEEKKKLASPVPWLVFDEAVAFLLILICATIYYTYNAFAGIKKNQSVSNTFITAEQTSLKNIAITSSDISPYLTSVFQMICKSNDDKLTSGSGMLWKTEENKYNILTNNHIILNTKKCIIYMDDDKNSSMFEISPEKIDEFKDIAILKIGKELNGTDKKISDYNFNLSSLRKCPTKTSIGSPVAIIGYPSYTKRNLTVNIKDMGDVSTVYRATTNGTISSYDTSLSKPNGNLLNENYFISAKIDIGNSGGAAISKDENGLCMLGIPTWVTVGTYETQGIVQNIANIVP